MVVVLPEVLNVVKVPYLLGMLVVFGRERFVVEGVCGDVFPDSNTPRGSLYCMHPARFMLLSGLLFSNFDIST